MELRRKRKRRAESVYEEPEPVEDAEDPEPGAQKGKKPKRIFVPNPGPPSKRAAVDVNEFGHVRKTIEAESPEAASHWDARHWWPLH